MRSFFAAALVLLSLLLTAVAVPCIWAETHIVREQGFVSTMSPLGSDRAFQSALANGVSELVTSQLKIDDRLRTLIQPAIESAAGSITADPGYPQAWTETLRRSHALSFGDDGPAGGAAGLTLDIAPMLQLLAAKVPAGLASAVLVPPQVPISLGRSVPPAAVSRLAMVAPLGYGLAVAAALALLFALVIARRRSTTVLLFGLGLAVTCGLWKLAVDGVGQRLRSGWVAIHWPCFSWNDSPPS
ncbi:hypothetical protein IV498_08800 [Paenarthrobacter sp. Z7-10]|uniref:hypothetical protein n=1 Tax=Paenarthrobacter sp. Z7-10 TaxID=2787635 RepID=UPI0022A93D4F|nr:hypothetical protein [Paenarthrobacter sp. Z7-10]MCZ2403276.1 hypothetical protein [Paenarthrobacter sp. Z7-10]